jgi:hypothetical protein
LAVAHEPQPEPAAERLFRDDLARGPFLAGADRGYWRLGQIEFPHAIIEVATAPRPGSPDWLALRFDVSDYPHAPSAQPWDLATSGALAPQLWPGGNARIMQIFNPGWRVDALYFPMDRLALQGHDPWLAVPGCRMWDSAKDITQYLQVVHELLTEAGYTGVRG